jgi:hypothetical protein
MQLLRDNIDNPPWTGLSTSHETSEVGWFHEASIPADLSLERVLPQQIRRMFDQPPETGPGQMLVHGRLLG